MSLLSRWLGTPAQQVCHERVKVLMADKHSNI